MPSYRRVHSRSSSEEEQIDKEEQIDQEQANRSNQFDFAALLGLLPFIINFTPRSIPKSENVQKTKWACFGYVRGERVRTFEKN